MVMGVAQTATRVLTDAGGATTTISFASLPTAGHGVIVYIVDGVATNPTLDPTVSDNQGVGNTYTKARSTTDSSAGQLAGIWRCNSIGATSGTFTITVTHAASSTNYSIIQIQEANQAIQLDNTAAGSATGGTSMSITAPALTGGDGLACTCMTIDSSNANNNISNSSGYTNAMVEQDSANHVAGSGDYKVVAVATNITYTFAAGSTDSAGVMAVFIPVSSGNTIAVPAGSMTLSGKVPTILNPNVVSVPAGALTLTGFAPTVLTPNLIAVPAGALTLTAQIPTVIATANNAITVPAGALTLSGFAPDIGANQLIAVPSLALTLSGFAPAVIGDPIIISGSNPGGFGGGSAKFEFSKKPRKTKKTQAVEISIDNSEYSGIQHKNDPALAQTLAIDLLSELKDESDDEEVLAMLLADEENTISMLITSISQGL